MKAIAPLEEPIIVSEPLKSVATIPSSYTSYRDACVAESKLVEKVTYPDDKGLALVVENMQSIKGIITTVEDVEEAARKPVNAWLKDIRKKRDNFLAPLIEELDRVGKIVTSYRTLEIEDRKQKDRAAREVAAKAEREAADAQRKIEEQERELARARAQLASEELTKNQRAEAEAKRKEAEEKLLDAELAAESAAITSHKSSLAINAPTNIPKGLTTRVRYDFEVTVPLTFAAKKPELWTWHPGTETLKLERAVLLKLLNSEAANEMHSLLPQETQQSIVHSALGIRVYVSISTHVRK